MAREDRVEDAGPDNVETAGSGSPDQPELPAGLEAEGRDETLASAADVHPTGTRGDHRASVSGTGIPGGPQPAAASEETKRVKEGGADAAAED